MLVVHANSPRGSTGAWAGGGPAPSDPGKTSAPVPPREAGVGGVEPSREEEPILHGAGPGTPKRGGVPGPMRTTERGVSLPERKVQGLANAGGPYRLRQAGVPQLEQVADPSEDEGLRPDKVGTNAQPQNPVGGKRSVANHAEGTGRSRGSRTSEDKVAPGAGGGVGGKTGRPASRLAPAVDLRSEIGPGVGCR